MESSGNKTLIRKLKQLETSSRLHYVEHGRKSEVGAYYYYLTPKEMKNLVRQGKKVGTSERIAQLASAEAANATAGAIGTSALLTNGKFYNAPALVKLTFSLLMQRNLNQSLKNMLELPNNTKIGSRVNSTIQSNIKTKEAVWAKVSALEQVKLIFKGFF